MNECTCCCVLVLCRGALSFTAVCGCSFARGGHCQVTVPEPQWLGQLAEEVENLAPSIVAPGNRRSPTIRPITKLTKDCPADLWLLMQGTGYQNIDTSLQFSGWCPMFRGLAGAFAWGTGDPFGMICTGSRTIGLTPSQLDMEWQPHLKESSVPCRSTD